jgi:hypothetical protein
MYKDNGGANSKGEVIYMEYASNVEYSLVSLILIGSERVSDFGIPIL